MGDKIRINNDYGDKYEPSDSEDNFSEEEKSILAEVRSGRRRERDSNNQEVLAFADSDQDTEDETNPAEDDDGESMNDSDIEGKADDDDGLPDSKDWGNKSRNYYNTDFVDPDFETYNEEEEEMARQEESEAKIIQLRLAKQMREEDFLFDELVLPTATKVAEGKDGASPLVQSTKVKADFARLSKRERHQLFQKDSPEFGGLISDFKDFLQETEKLLSPIMEYVNKHRVPMIPALKFTQLYQNMVLTYCSNVAFYLLLKAKRISIKNHPITKRLVQLKKLVTQLKDKYDNIIRPQLEALLERIDDGDEFEILEIKPKKKSKLFILDEYATAGDKRTSNSLQLDEAKKPNGAPGEEDEESDDVGEDELEAMEVVAEDENARRGITYQMAKNKGLTPHRKKELRNPRVKHRSKFRKALIRRKGAVRTVRNETKRYGGEMSGIKSTVSKSIKFKV